MIRVFYSPQVNEEYVINYIFDGELITATLSKKPKNPEILPPELIEETVDTFDFAGLPDGAIERVESVLAYNPIINAQKYGGVLYVELLNFITEDASESEKFPVWIEVE